MKNDSRVSTKVVLKELWKGVVPHKRLFWVTVIAYTIFEVIGLIVPLFYKNFFDSLGAPGIGAADLIKIIIIIAAFHFVNWILRSIGSFALSACTAKVMARLKQNTFNYLIFHSRNFFVNNFAGALVQRVNRFAFAFEVLFDILVFNLIPIVIAIGGAIIVTAFIAPLISIIILAWAVLIIVANFFFSRWKIKYDIARAAADSATTGFLSDDIINYISIKLLNGHKREAKRFKEISNDQAEKTLFTWQLANSASVVQDFFIYLVEFAAFYYTIQLWQNGQAAIGTFVLLQTYIIGISYNLWGITRMFRGIYQAMADSKEMVEILSLPHEIRDIAGAKHLPKAAGAIEFRNVFFSFQKDFDILKDFSLNIKPGEKVAIVGPSGTGKTTLTNLLLRLFDPNAGAILIDGRDIREITQESLRANISLVPQDPALFHRTIMENIRYGRPDASDDEVIRAAKLAHCDEFVQKMPAGYDTLVGERGVKLSGGERQRVAIARAILKDAPILVLDEATSSLDSESEKLIQDALEILMRGRTAIAIAHRLSTIRQMDRVVVVDGGAIAEEGTHQSLIRKPRGLYKKLWRLQSSGFIE